MTAFRLATATDAAPTALAKSCADQLADAHDHTVGFVYATSLLAGHLKPIVDTLRQRTGIETWIGTVGYGICATGAEFFDQPAVVAMTCRFEPGAYQLVPSLTEPDAAAALKVTEIPAGIGIVHGDPRNARVTEIVARLARERGLYLVGGLTAADSDFPQVAGNKLAEGGLSGILLGGRLNVAVGLTQGCSPVGPAHQVTRCDGNILVTLANERAYDVLCEDVGIAEGVDPRPWLKDVHVALPVAGSDRADYLVRNLTGIDARRGLVGVGASIDEGGRVMFVRRDAESAVKDLRRMLGELQSRVTGTPKAGLYYSCVARGPNLFQAKAQELTAIRDTFGDIPIAGFFGNGEISNDRVYGYTGVLVLFS